MTSHVEILGVGGSCFCFSCFLFYFGDFPLPVSLDCPVSFTCVSLAFSPFVLVSLPLVCQFLWSRLALRVFSVRLWFVLCLILVILYFFCFFPATFFCFCCLLELILNISFVFKANVCSLTCLPLSFHEFGSLFDEHDEVSCRSIK